MSESGTKQDRYHVCVTCGQLKHEDLFNAGDCTCTDCYGEGRTGVKWLEADDGDGFVANGGESMTQKSK